MYICLTEHKLNWEGCVSVIIKASNNIGFNTPSRSKDLLTPQDPPSWRYLVLLLSNPIWIKHMTFTSFPLTGKLVKPPKLRRSKESNIFLHVHHPVILSILAAILNLSNKHAFQILISVRSIRTKNCQNVVSDEALQLYYSKNDSLLVQLDV